MPSPLKHKADRLVDGEEDEPSHLSQVSWSREAESDLHVEDRRAYGEMSISEGAVATVLARRLSCRLPSPFRPQLKD